MFDFKVLCQFFVSGIDAIYLVDPDQRLLYSYHNIVSNGMMLFYQLYTLEFENFLSLKLNPKVG